MESQQSGFAHTVLISGLALALIGVLGFIFWFNIIQPKLNESQNQVSSSSDWLTYSDEDIPYVFDYPKSIQFIKNKYVSEGMTKGMGLKGFTQITLSSGTGSLRDMPIRISYEIGNSGLSEGLKLECGYKIKMTFSNKLVSNGRIGGCGEESEWIFKEKHPVNNKPTELTVYSSEKANFNSADFKKIVESFRRK